MAVIDFEHQQVHGRDVHPPAGSAPAVGHRLLGVPTARQFAAMHLAPLQAAAAGVRSKRSSIGPHLEHRLGGIVPVVAVAQRPLAGADSGRLALRILGPPINWGSCRLCPKYMRIKRASAVMARLGSAALLLFGRGPGERIVHVAPRQRPGPRPSPTRRRSSGTFRRAPPVPPSPRSSRPSTANRSPRCRSPTPGPCRRDM